MFEFQYPYFFILLFLPLAMFLLFRPEAKEKTGTPAIYNPNLKWLARAYGSKTMGLASNFNITLYVIWALLTFAMMHPQRVERLSKTVTEGYDIMMAVDLSRSMAALDLGNIDKKDFRNRLDVTKQAAAKFIEGRTNDRIGLILFGEKAYLQTPLSPDAASVTSMMNLADIGMAGDATAIGDAVGLAVKSLIKRSESSRMIILLTDGSNTAGAISPFEASRLAKSYGIKIYTIGIGKAGVVPFPTETGEVAYAKIDMDEKILQKISDETGGAYFLATDESSLKEIYKKIDELERSEAKTSEYVLRKQFYNYPLSLAMMMLIYMIIMRYNWSRFIK